MAVTRLQGVVASIEAPSEDYKNEIRDQVMPDPAAVNKLRAKLDVFKQDLAEVKAQMSEGGASAEEAQRKANEAGRAARMAEMKEVEDHIADVQAQVEGVKSGAKLEAAMTTLKRTIEEEKQGARPCNGNVTVEQR